MIDLEKLAEVAGRDGDREVVTRRWLKQVHAELSAARRAAGVTILPAAALDVGEIRREPPPAHRG